MKYTFHAHGHANILGTHKNTFEFTKDKDVSLSGDCIIGVESDFELEEIKKFVSNGNARFKITIEWKNESEQIECHLNKEFNSNHELVFRKTEFISERTLGTKANKAAIDLNKGLIDFLKEGRELVTVVLEGMP